MTQTYLIQPAIFCEPCKDCGARPIIKLENSKYTVMCPNNHYSTKPGLIDVNDWNIKNKVHTKLSGIKSTQKAS
jgi:hypothetical protein